MREMYVASVVLLLAAAAAGSAAAAEQVTLTVAVVDGDGAPVPDARVTAEWADGRATDTTRSNGRVLLDVPAGGDVTITVDDDRYVRNHPYVLLDAAAGEVTVPVAERGRAAVHVRDDDGSVAGARVTVSRDGDAIAAGETNDDGAFTFSLPVNAAFDLRVDSPGYEPAVRTLSVGESATAVTVATRRTPTLSLSAANSKVVVGQTLRVAVTDEYGDPVAGAEIRLDGEHVAETDRDGVAHVAIGEAGERRLVAVAGGVTSDAAIVEGVRAGGDDPARTPTPTEIPTAMQASDSTGNDTAPETTPGVGPGVTPLAALAAVALSLGVAVGRRTV